MIRNSDLFDSYVVHDQMVHVELSLRRVWSLMGGNSVLLSQDDIDAACALQSQIQISSLSLTHMAGVNFLLLLYRKDIGGGNLLFLCHCHCHCAVTYLLSGALLSIIIIVLWHYRL